MTGSLQLRQALKELTAETLSEDHNPHSWAASPVWRGVWVVPVLVPHPSGALAQDGYQ